MSLKNGPPSE